MKGCGIAPKQGIRENIALLYIAIQLAGKCIATISIKSRGFRRQSPSLSIGYPLVEMFAGLACLLTK